MVTDETIAAAANPIIILRVKGAHSLLGKRIPAFRLQLGGPDRVACEGHTGWRGQALEVWRWREDDYSRSRGTVIFQ